MRVYVKTPSRLHFALIDLEGSFGRVDGGVGLTIKSPNVVLEASPGSSLCVEGLMNRKVEEYSRRFLKHFRITGGARIKVSHIIPSHVGLGATTQLSLAVASALARIYGVDESVPSLAKTLGRGGTSGIGVAGFQSGGFIVDGGHPFKRRGGKWAFLPSSASRAPPPPILLRYPFPENWFFVIALPLLPKGLHGRAEVDLFKERCPIDESEVGRVCRLILMKMLPALKEHNIVEFGASLTQLQHLGLAAYTQDLMHPLVKECIEMMLENGSYGAGQSSFGPNAYGLVSGEADAKRLTIIIKELIKEQSDGDVFYTTANNKGAIIREFNINSSS